MDKTGLAVDRKNGSHSKIKSLPLSSKGCCFLSSGCTRNVPFFFEHFGNVAYSFVQYIGHTGMDSSHLLVNKVVFFHVFFRSLNGIVHILKCHVKEEWLLWVMGMNYLFYSLINQTGKMCYNSERFEPGSHFSRWSMIVRVNVVLNMTVFDSDWRLDNLCASHVQSQSELLSHWQ